MSWIASFYRTALGKKAVMAVTGAFLFGWVFAHMVGNLKVFLGPEHLNEYAKWLRTMGAPAMPHSALLWIVRVLMLVAIWLHIQAATQLTLQSNEARPIKYTRRDNVVASYASRTMRWGGVIIFLYIIYHLLHLTFGAHVAPVPYVENNPYHNVVEGFKVWWISAAYIVANLALGLHLWHGLRALFDSLGLNHKNFNTLRRWFAVAFALIITIGNISMPVAVLLGILR